jgi:hypothetical protein
VSLFRERIGRAAVGALWSSPIRLVTIPAICAVAASEGMMAGIATSIGLRFLDNLATEFAFWPMVKSGKNWLVARCKSFF